MTKHLVFKNIFENETCKNEIYLTVPNRCDYGKIIDEMATQGWILNELNNKKTYGMCECGEPIFLKDSKYCPLCLKYRKEQ